MLSTVLIILVLSPAISAIVCGLGNQYLPKNFVHRLAIFSCSISLMLSIYLLYSYWHINEPIYLSWYTWAGVGAINFELGFMLDQLSLVMMFVVTFVSLMVYVYTIEYMEEDVGYNRFFSYLCLFTFAMLMLVTANNFTQLFFGWEGVGLASYLLIGFWFKKSSATAANFKAFLVNRVGDTGFLLGLGLLFVYFGSLNYVDILPKASELAGVDLMLLGGNISVNVAISSLLFIGAMAKSAQIPLHVWLPDSMEGPTPISALIHAATMVTAGIFLVTRFSVFFVQAPVVMAFILFVGIATVLMMGAVAIVENDIKRVIAYSTLSQLGYMVAALGLGVFNIAIFHLVTHAFFKALLFLGAGCVICSMHHEQDLRKMGFLLKKMPFTALFMFIGTLALIGVPGTSGFYSKHLIVEAAHFKHYDFAYWLLEIGMVLTTIYSVRLFYLTFLSKPYINNVKVVERSWLMLVPLFLLAIPSLFSGIFAYDHFVNGSWFLLDISLLENFVLSKKLMFKTLVMQIFIAFITIRVLAQGGFRIPGLMYVLENKFGFDAFNAKFVAPAYNQIGCKLYQFFDIKVVEKLFLGSLVCLTKVFSKCVTSAQTGYLYDYCRMIVIGVSIGLFIMLSFIV